MQKVRHPKTKGVIAIEERQAETFKQMGFEPVGDDVPTDVELRDLAGMLSRSTGEDLSASDDIEKLRAAHDKVHPPSDPELAALLAEEKEIERRHSDGDSTGITGDDAGGESAAEGEKSPGRKVRSSANREKSE